MVAAGPQFHDVAFHITSTPVVAERDVVAGDLRVVAGQCLGIRQVAAAIKGQREVIRLELEMALGLAHPEDAIIIEGDPPITIRIPGAQLATRQRQPWRFRWLVPSSAAGRGSARCQSCQSRRSVGKAAPAPYHGSLLTGTAGPGSSAACFLVLALRAGQDFVQSRDHLD